MKVCKLSAYVLQKPSQHKAHTSLSYRIISSGALPLSCKLYIAARCKCSADPVADVPAAEFQCGLDRQNFLSGLHLV